MWWRRQEPGAVDERFGELNRMRRDMEQLFQALDPYALEGRPAGVYPLLNVTQDDDSYFVRAELPGVNPKELRITTANNRLELSGNRDIPSEHEEASYHRRERDGGAFNRSISLAGGFDPERVQASYADGILCIQLPKTAAHRPRQIAVNTA